MVPDVLAGSAPTIPEVRDPGDLEREFCETDGEYGRIGYAYSDLGEAFAIPVYIGSDDCVTGFRFRFSVADEVDIDSVVGNAWTHGIDPLYYDGSGYLIVTKSNSVPDGSCITPDANDVFLTLYGNTACQEVHNVCLPVQWAPWDMYNPETRLAHTECDVDTLETIVNGAVCINNIEIGFAVSEGGVALVGELDTVMVTCTNNYEFASFAQALTYDPEELEFVDVIYLDRTAVGVTDDGSTLGLIEISGTNAAGFGTTADGVEFYQVIFKVVNDVDDDYLLIGFADTPREVYDLCDKPVHQFVSIYYGGGWIRVPPYRVFFDIGDAVCLNDDSDEFSVPLYMKNNFPITEFSLSLKYNDYADASEFLRFENTLGLTAVKKVCSEYKSLGYEYVVLMTEGITELAPRDQFECIGYLFFENSLSLPGQTWRDSLEFKEYGCCPAPEVCDDKTWVRTYNDVWGLRQYDFSDVQMEFIDGWISFEDPLVSVNIPSAYAAAHWHKEGGVGWYTYDNWALTSFMVYSNVDLESVSFTVHWSPDEFCVSTRDIPGNTQVILDEDLQQVTVTITGIQASPYWAGHGKLRFENPNTVEQWGNMTVSDVVAVETEPSGDLQITGAAGAIHLWATSMSSIPCDDENENWSVKPAAVPLVFALAQNRPNPFNASTIIEFTLPEAAFTTLDIFNVLGQRVTTLMNDYTEAGPYSIFWNGRDEHGLPAASGIYFYRLQSGKYLDAKKMVLMK